VARLGISQTGLLYFEGYKVRRLSCLGGLDIGDFDVEVERLVCQRMIEIDDDGFFLDLVHAYGDGPSVRALAHQHGANG
jgi:hypothetical protein